MSLPPQIRLYLQMPHAASPLVHLELQTANLPRACSFYTRLFGWSTERIDIPSGSYLALDLGGRVGGGVAEREGGEPLWLPYVEVPEIFAAVRLARALGASVLLEPREGPAGWRSVVAAPAGGSVALWQPKSAEVGELESCGPAGDEFAGNRGSHLHTTDPGETAR
jgi:predicted enzyme related to lactoylglutathione lyase